MSARTNLLAALAAALAAACTGDGTRSVTEDGLVLDVPRDASTSPVQLGVRVAPDHELTLDSYEAVLFDDANGDGQPQDDERVARAATEASSPSSELRAQLAWDAGRELAAPALRIVVGTSAGDVVRTYPLDT